MPVILHLPLCLFIISMSGRLCKVYHVMILTSFIMPTDCYVLRTLTILPAIRQSLPQDGISSESALLSLMVYIPWSLISYDVTGSWKSYDTENLSFINLKVHIIQHMNWILRRKEMFDEFQTIPKVSSKRKETNHPNGHSSLLLSSCKRL